ncbi:MAG TPA: hypothetical protein VG323_18965 [Thermoanaerobaculia bacterium]|nr:hypothetical protein [Thermoanaerobaculia bacterium]
MKRYSLAVFLFVCAAPLFAQRSGSTLVNGRIDYDSAGVPQSIQFRAHQHDSEPVTGDISFDGTVETSPGVFTNVSFTVTLDCLATAINRAALSGVITSSSEPSLVGQRSLLAVEDNGQGNNSPPDRYAWYPLTADNCVTFPLVTATLQDVPSGHVHIKASNTPF